MDTFVDLPTEEREEYFREAAARMGLPPHVIEKDFWVCWMLKRLFALECVAGELLFKGGTSLSKVYGLIRRFSEDIDLSIHRRSLGFEGKNDPANLSGKPHKKKDAALGKAARKKIEEEIRPELDAAFREHLGDDGWQLEPDLTDKDGQTLSFVYPTTELTPHSSAYLRPAVKIEFGARADHEPAERKTVQPYLVEAIPDALDDPETEVKTISAVRTFWEKATILHQQAHRAREKPIPARYSRHYCDLASMIKEGIGEEASKNEDLLAAVVAHKIVFYRSAWASYESAVRGTLRLVPPEDRHTDLAKDLDSMHEMFFDDPPKLEDVLETLRMWEENFNKAD